MLLLITGLAVLAGLLPWLWLACWQVGVLLTALLAPLLGAARMARSVMRGSAEAEFVRWFRPVDTSPFGDSAGTPFSTHRPLDSRVACVVSPSE